MCLLVVPINHTEKEKSSYYVQYALLLMYSCITVSFCVFLFVCFFGQYSSSCSHLLNVYPMDSSLLFLFFCLKTFNPFKSTFPFPGPACKLQQDKKKPCLFSLQHASVRPSLLPCENWAQVVSVGGAVSKAQQKETVISVGGKGGTLNAQKKNSPHNCCICVCTLNWQMLGGIRACCMVLSLLPLTLSLSCSAKTFLPPRPDLPNPTSLPPPPASCSSLDGPFHGQSQ